MKILCASSIVALVLSVCVSAAPIHSAEENQTSLLKRGISYKGTATWYKPASEGGSQGACNGVHIDNSSYYVALNHAQYGNMNANSSWCGKKIKITGPAGSVTAKIMDACPGCGKNDLDLTPALFLKVVGSMTKGVGSITWQLA
ncbi:hypothetical protein G6F56_007570 [Rhizopus delemar]|uniref:RlpA-like protein double-psi beta-barrel domain-containing protein n=1 Tax=Rhizopus stolonifer TaxID=4846 RepID=A0A367K4L9_RHIST|nr:hypothetical protein G6F56_007570 [Rhizopus delemar]RCH97128.1 hypothetical protein CU098_007445 [Rhizopus stolonifer]